MFVISYNSESLIPKIDNDYVAIKIWQLRKSSKENINPRTAGEGVTGISEYNKSSFCYKKEAADAFVHY